MVGSDLDSSVERHNLGDYATNKELNEIRTPLFNK